MNRNIAEVIAKILAITPESESGLRAGLDSIKSSAGFKAPEVMWQCWARLADVLEHELGIPSEGWHHDVVSIVQGKE